MGASVYGASAATGDGSVIRRDGAGCLATGARAAGSGASAITGAATGGSAATWIGSGLADEGGGWSTCA
jgi:hypothetical protein